MAIIFIIKPGTYRNGIIKRYLLRWCVDFLDSRRIILDCEIPEGVKRGDRVTVRISSSGEQSLERS